MALAQTTFAGYRDDGDLNSPPSHPQDSPWTQAAGRPFRVRFGISGTGTVGGTLEFSNNGTTFVAASDTSGTIHAARSGWFNDGAATTAILSSETAYTTGYADEDDAVTDTVDLSASHTEVEYAVELVPAEVTAGGTIYLRVAGCDTYNSTASLVCASTFLDLVRLKVGDDDPADEILTDAEVNDCIAAWPDNLDLAAATAAEAIAAKYARDFNFSADGQSFNRRERVLHYSELARTLRRGGHLVWP